jgi:hypothetical protein
VKGISSRLQPLLDLPVDLRSGRVDNPGMSEVPVWLVDGPALFERPG